jgi:hypothetical protein
MEMSAPAWDLVRMVLVAYIVYLLNKHDKNMTELFKRITAVEINCAASSGHVHHRESDHT